MTSNIGKLFESSVNPEGSKTKMSGGSGSGGFESSVNPEGSKTAALLTVISDLFESSVNPEGSKTYKVKPRQVLCLRVV